MSAPEKLPASVSGTPPCATFSLPSRTRSCSCERVLLRSSISALSASITHLQNGTMLFVRHALILPRSPSLSLSLSLSLSFSFPLCMRDTCQTTTMREARIRHEWIVVRVAGDENSIFPLTVDYYLSDTRGF